MINNENRIRADIKCFCTGCGLCHAINNNPFSIDNKGFPYPNMLNGNLEFYQNVCPVYYYYGKAKHDIWGICKKAVIGYSSNENTRFQSASGGALTELAIYLLRTKKVDGIIHTTFDPDDPTKTITCISTTEEEVKNRSGSRYSISVPLFEIKKNVKYNNRYAFIGKPCDVMALRQYKNYTGDLKNITVLMSFFCAGEPSCVAQNNLIKALNCKIEDIKELRYRGNGWPGYTTISLKNGSCSKLEYKYTWARYLGRDIRKICRFCLDGTGDAADIVAADFWYLKNGSPDFGEHEGRNIIIARTDIGQEVLDMAIQSGRLTVERNFTDYMDELNLYQPAQYKRKGTMKSMKNAMILCNKQFPKYSRSILNKYASHLKMTEKMKYFLGTIKRIIRKKI